MNKTTTIENTMKTQQAKHTPTPYHWEKAKTLQYLKDKNGNCFAQISMPAINKIHPDSRSIYEANAAFIVRAVNSHDELLEALKAIVCDMAECYCADMVVSKESCAYCKAKQAIAKAEGK